MIDARLAFLIRAAARYDLFRTGEMELDEAFGGLVDDICERRAIEKHFDTTWRKEREKKLRAWRANNGSPNMLRVWTSAGSETDKEGD